MEMHLDSLGGWFQVKVPERSQQLGTEVVSFVRQWQWCVFQHLQSDPTHSNSSGVPCPDLGVVDPLLSLQSSSLSPTSCPHFPVMVSARFFSLYFIAPGFYCMSSLCVSHWRWSGKSGWPSGYPLAAGRACHATAGVRLPQSTNGRRCVCCLSLMPSKCSLSKKHLKNDYGFDKSLLIPSTACSE